jgi:hypothetical protein
LYVPALFLPRKPVTTSGINPPMWARYPIPLNGSMKAKIICKLPKWNVFYFLFKAVKIRII